MYGRDLFYSLIYPSPFLCFISRLGRYLPGRQRSAWPAGLRGALIEKKHNITDSRGSPKEIALGATIGWLTLLPNAISVAHEEYGVDTFDFSDMLCDRGKVCP